MEKVLFVTYIFFYILQDVTNRISIHEAYCYRKSKSMIRQERKGFTLWEKFLCKYAKTSKTFAPRHMKLFFFDFYCNHLLSFVLILLWFLFYCSGNVKMVEKVIIIMIMKIVILDGISNIYGAVCAMLGGGKRWNFDIFKKP